MWGGKMVRRAKHHIISALVYTGLVAAIVWQGMLLVRQLYPHQALLDVAMIDVYVEGNVRRPGRYRVAQGTTQFEILKVAGVRPTSDLSLFNLTAQLDSASELSVGTLEKPVGATEESHDARLEFFLGEISVIGSDGRSISQHEGLAISPGDRIQTEASSQAELSIGAYSRIDMDNFAEIVFDKIGAIESDRIVDNLYQKSGTSWYKVVYTKNSELFKINTLPVEITIGGSGADFLVDVQSDQLSISLMDGLLLVERVGGGEAINMITGQSVTIYTDGRPFLVTKVAPDISVSERFDQLSREKVNYMSRQMPLNLLFCSAPAVYYFINIQYARGVCNVVRLPGELLIEQFANGISTLDQAFLYGGPVMVATFVERIIDARIPKYCVFDKDAIIKIAGVMGGVQTKVDAHAASFLNINQGVQKLSDKTVLRYLSATISGVEDAHRRQSDLIKSIFDDLSTKKLVPTLILADQIITTIETNLGASEIMDQYSKFSEKAQWDYREMELPVTPVRRNKRNCFEPQLQQCKELLTSYE